jgi:hypothetical protein
MVVEKLAAAHIESALKERMPALGALREGWQLGQVKKQ